MEKIIIFFLFLNYFSNNISCYNIKFIFQILFDLAYSIVFKAICTVGEVIRGNDSNQQLFSTVMMQSNPPRPIITILLLSMINEKQPFHLRSSILYCFECFLYKNEDKKAQIINTLLPKETSGMSDINTGQILCTGLFAPNDFVSNWLCAVALAHTINNTNTLKEQLLRVQLAINSQDKIQAVSLLQQCMNILSECSSNSINYQFQSKISILMLISTWLSNCPEAVNVFLSNEQNIPYVIIIYYQIKILFFIFFLSLFLKHRRLIPKKSR